MKISKLLLTTFWVSLFLGLLIVSSHESVLADQAQLTEIEIESYLKKKSLGDTGMCLVDGFKLEIIGISDLIPGQQVEVFYKFEYQLRCNNSRKKKDGRLILSAARLRNGDWIDRDNFKVIQK